MAHLFRQLQESLESRYRLRRELGGGSMSTVYLADDLERDRPVALKVLHTEYAGDLAGERFLREIEIAARLQHPHIVPLLDSGQAAGALYLIMPYIEGESLRSRLGREGRLPVAEVVRILADVADALDYAHRKGIVHRDIKPDNILLVGRHAMVADFGVAKAVSAATVEPRHLTIGVAIGTPAYMAPEQATADPGQDHRVDLYALGVVGYELLTGHPPFDGPTAQAVLTAHVLDDPVPVEDQRAEIPEALAGLIGRALAKRPEGRWQSAAEMLRLLEPLATPSGGTPPAPTAPWQRRASWVLWLTGAAGVVAALVAAVRFTFGPSGEAPPRALAQQQLTYSGDLSSAALSPDGELLAFVTHSSGMDHLMVQDLRGGTPRQLAEAPALERLDWSGDGAEIRYHAATTGARGLYAVPRLGGEPRALGTGFWSALSPDGNWLADFPVAVNQLLLVDLRRGDSTRVATPGFRWHGPVVWSPQSDRIAFPVNSPDVGRAGMMLYRLGRSSLDTLFQDSVVCGTPAWDGTGETLYFLHGNGQISNLMRLSLEPGAGRAAGPPRLLVAGLPVAPEYEVQLSLSRDGRRLVYLRHQGKSNLGVIALDADVAEAHPRVLTTGSAFYQDARFAPDGSAIAALRRETDGITVQVLTPELRAIRTVGRLPDAGGITWSPDGTIIAVAALGDAQVAGIQLFPVNGGPPMRRLERAIGGGLTWEVGRAIIAQAPDNRSLLAFEPAGSRARRLEMIDTLGWLISPRVAPDGQTIGFTWNRGNQRIGLYRVTPGQEPKLLAPGTLAPLRWSADGKVLYAASWPFVVDSTRVVAVPAQGGPARLLAGFDGRVKVLDISPDARDLLVNVVDSTADAWLIPSPDSAGP